MKKHIQVFQLLYGSNRLRSLIPFIALLALHLPKATIAQVYTSTTAGTYTYTVTAGVTAVEVTLQGAAGGTPDRGSSYDRGGYGAQVKTILAVTPGQVLSGAVGGIGGNGTVGTAGSGGYHGGGAGATDGGDAGGGGGGATDMYLGSTLLMVAGGGGGAGENCGSNEDRGGDGGGTSGIGETGNSCDFGGGCGGNPAAGGACGPEGSGYGSTVYGGAGGAAASYLPGGGGGGGYFSGGGGYFSGGGGGGDYYGGTGVHFVSETRGVSTGDGSVVIAPVISGYSSLCAGATYTFTAAVSGGTWSSSNTAVGSVSGSTSANPVSVAGVSPGTFTLTYTVSSVSVTYLVSVNPTPSTSVSSGTTICEGASTSLTASGATTYTWAPSTGLSATTGAAVSASPYSSVTYTVTGTACGSSTATVLVTVTSAPVISGISPSSGVNGSAITITGTGFNPSSTSDVVWFGATAGSITSASSTSITATLDAEATYGNITVDNLACNLQAQSSQLFQPTYSGTSGSIVNFAAKTDAVLSSGYYAYSTLLADLNNDGKADLVCFDNEGSLWVNKNTGGSGTVSFASGSRFFFDYFNKASLAVADLDGDGLPDVVTAYWVPDGGDLVVFKNTSSGSSISFGSAQYFGSSTEENFSLAIGDIDGDGRPDIVYGDPFRNRLLILMNTSTVGSISFASTEVTVAVSGFLAGLTLCDLDHDGKLDIAGATSGTNIEVWRNTSTPGSVSFATGENISLTTSGTSETQAYGIAAADLDGDGKPDLAVTGYSSDFISILRNTSTGSGSISFATAVVLPAGASIGEASNPVPTPALGDFDGDGNTDIAVAAGPSSKVAIFHNTGGGVAGTISFSSLAFGTDSYPTEVAVGDLDGDGKADLAVSISTADHISVYRNLPLQPITGTAAICAGSGTTLSDAATGGTWSSSNTSVASLSSSTSGAVTGVASGSATITYSLGIGYTTFQITVNSVPTTSVSSGVAICEGASSSLTAAGATIYTWAPSTGLSATTGSTVTASPYSSVTYTVTGTNAGCSSNTATVTVTVTPAPTAISTASGPIISLVAGSGTGSYSGDGGAATAAGVYKPEGVVVDGNGNIYFADNVDGRVRKVSSGVITTFAGTGSTGFSGDNGPATAAVFSNDIKGLAIDAAGNLYIADANNNRIRMVNTSGVITTVAGGGGSSADGVQATAESLSYPTGVAVDISGNIYIGEASGQKIRKVSTSGIITTLAGTGTYGYNGDGIAATSAELFDPYGVSVDVWGNVYIADYANSRVRKVNTSGIISTIAGTGVDAFSGDGGPATAAKIQSPFGVYADGSGNIYIADYYSYRIRLVTASGIITTFAGNGTDSYSGIGGSATAAAIGGPAGVFEDAVGNVYISEYDENRVVKVSNSYQVCSGASVILNDATGGGAWSSANTAIGTIGAGTGAFIGVSTGTTLITYSISGCSTTSMMVVNATPSVTATGGGSICSGGTGLSLSASGAGTGGTYTWSPATGLSATTGAAVTANPTGSVTYTVTGTSTGCSNTASVTVTVNAGAGAVVANRIISTVAGNGTAGDTGDGAAATAAELNGPQGVVLDGSGNIYIADYYSNVVRMVNPSGIITTVAGNGSFSYGGDGGQATAAELAHPSSVAIDVAGNLYIAEVGNQRIRKVTTSGIISTIAGNGTGGYAGDGGPATAAVINSVTSLTLDGSGNIYMVDYGNNRIRKINTAGIISTIAGNGTAGFSGDGGQATAAELNSPYGMAIDGSGNIYIADLSNKRIRMVNSSGIISTIAGNGSAGFSGDGGPATDAKFNGLVALVVDGSGNLYVADANNQRVRMVNTSGIVSTVAGNGGTGATGDGGSAISAQLSYPTALAIDAGYNLYVAVDAKVRKVAVTGNGSVCAGSVITITDPAPGGAWSSSNTAVGTISAGTGLFTGVAAGTAMVTYNLSGCMATGTITVQITPAITPSAATVCLGSSTALTASGSSAYTWAPSTGLSATTGAGITANPTITTIYTVTGTLGCAQTVAVTVGPVSGSVLYGGDIATIAGNGTSGYSGNGGSAITAEINTPFGLVADMSGNVYFADNGNNVVRKVSAAGIITTVAGGGSGGDGPATAAILYSPSDVALDAGGNLYITDFGDHSVKKVNTAGIMSTIAGTYGGYSGDGGLAIDAELDEPSGVAIDGSGNIYIADYYNSRVRMINSSGIINTVAGNGTYGYSGDGGAATAAELSYPSGVAVDGSGNIYISDDNNSCVRMVNTSGVISTFAGNGTSGYSGDGGAATASELYEPWELATDASGNVYIADRLERRIRMVNSSGIISTIAGNGINSYSGDGGPSTSAAIGATYGVAVDASGNIYISSQNQTIRKFSLPGNGSVCPGGTETLFDLTTGGAWSSSNTAVGVIGSGTGVFTGVSTGTAVITYGVTGCLAMATVTVNGTPSAISGSSSVCAGETATLSDGVSGGTWTGSNAAVATIGSSSGIVSSVLAGTAIITYSLTGGCSPATVIVTVNPLPSVSAVSGASTVTADSATITLTDGTSGGVWSSSNTSIATIGTGTGVVAGVAAGSVIISYTFSNGCGTATATTTITVNAPTTDPITGTATVCAGSSTTLSDATSGGAWGSSNTLVATVGTGTGIVTGVGAGTATISYVVSGVAATVTVTVNALPNAGSISGSGSVCTGANITLTDAATGGTWSSSSGSATVSGGVVTGATAGTAIISYAVINGCGEAVAAQIVSVVPSVVPSVVLSIVPGTTICSGTIDTFTAIPANGGPSPVYQWSVNGTSAGSSNTYSYTPSNGDLVKAAMISSATCASPDTVFASQTITVITAPSAGSISGASSVSTGSSITLTDGVSGGAWSSNNTAIATVGTGTGVVTGVAAGSVVISYTVSNACGTATASTTITVNTGTGSSTICVGSTTTISETTSGGTWHSSNTSVATVGSSSGIITGIAAGTVTISYNVSGSTLPQVISVLSDPAAIIGSSTVCTSSSVTLSDAIHGYDWSSSNTSIASVSGTGVVTGVSAGILTISYGGFGCSATKLLTVNPTPSAVTGPTTQCTGMGTQFADITTGGIWSSSNTSAATAGPSTGIVTGVTASSIATISYTVSGCSSVKTVTVYTSPNVVTAAGRLCSGLSATLADATSGGAWSSTNGTVATVGTTGIVSCLSAGTAIISYTLSSGCASQKTLTVSQSPATITGPITQCTGDSTLIMCPTPGGTWSSGNTSAATIGSLSGMIKGVSTGITGLYGVATISYTLSTGCYSLMTVSVYIAPYPITGSASQCTGVSTSMYDITTGGGWTSSNTSVAGIAASTGIITGVSAGTTLLSYTVPSGCAVTRVVSVYTSPDPVTGSPLVCTGIGYPFTDDVPGGTWSSSNVSAATVGTSGLVTGVTGPSAANITYTVPNGCMSVKTISVNPSPAAIAGSGSVSVGSTTTFADATGGGAWTSGNLSVATVGTSGHVTGVGLGTTVITYTLVSGCRVSHSVNVIPSSGRATESEGNSQASTTWAMQLIPNPNNGSFTIRGSLGQEQDEAVQLQVTDMLGHKVFSANATAINGYLDVPVQLATSLANGMYILSMQTNAEHEEFHFIVTR